MVHTFHSHNKRMAGLCNGWGLGRETAEYWAWLGRNYRVFAELVDISETTIVPENEIEEAMKMITGDTILNADMVLQHPGYYYLLAGECVRRQDSRTVAKEVSASFAAGLMGRMRRKPGKGVILMGCCLRICHCRQSILPNMGIEGRLRMSSWLAAKLIISWGNMMLH